MSVALAVLLQLAAGLPDRGIFPEYSQQVRIELPAGAPKPLGRPWLRADVVHRVLTLYDGADPLKAYPASIAAPLEGGSVATAGLYGGDPSGPTTRGVALRPDDMAEIGRVVRGDTPVLVGAPSRAEDRDGDGVVDRLDVLLGAKKLLLNKARYIERYVGIKYPGGDVPRTEGVCSDTVIRALRNAGIDLQKEVHDDIVRAKSAYPMVEKVDASINHRRVKTILPWFRRHFRTLPEGTPFMPGDVVFFDTFPSKSGPDHLGIVSDAAGASGKPAIINNWTDGTVDAEMDLLSFVPVTHHFRAPSPGEPREIARSN